MAAIETASQINEIGFPEFTSKLVKDTFDTLVASQIDQVEAFAELVQETSKSISDYINDTHDSISGEQIFAFIGNILPDLAENAIQAGQSSTNLVQDDVDALNPVLEITDETGGTIPNEISTGSSADEVLDAVARRIVANKYDILLEIVQTGLIRLVVTDGVIESKLNFRTYEFNRAKNTSTSYNRRSFGARARFGGFIGRAFGLRASAGYNSLAVSTSSSSERSGSGTSINIQGLVRINFKSDYQPLNNPV